MAWTVADLWNEVEGPSLVAPGSAWARDNMISGDAFAEDNWRRDPKRAPWLRKPTDSDRMMAYNLQASNLSKKLLEKNQANRSQRNAQMLQALLQQPNVNLFTPPRDETEAAAQGLVQQRINAENLGFKLSLDDRMRRRKEGAENQTRALQLRDQRLQEAMIPLQMAQARQNMVMQRETLKDRDESKVINERLRREQMAQSLAAQRASQQDRNFKQALDLVERTGIDINAVAKAFPGLTDEHLMALDAASKSLAEGDFEAYNEIKSAADDYTERLNEAVSGAGSAYEQANKPTWFGLRGGVDPQKLEQEKARARDAFLKSISREATGAGVRFDPGASSFVPAAPEPDRYVALDPAVLAQRSGRSRGVQGLLPIPRDGIPIVRSQQELQQYADYPRVRSVDGRLKLNPFYTRRSVQ